MIKIHRKYRLRFFSLLSKEPPKLRMKDNNIIHLLKSLLLHINQRHRSFLIVLLFVMVVAAFSEVLSIGIVLPFLAVLTNPDHVFNYEFLKMFLVFMNIVKLSLLYATYSIEVFCEVVLIKLDL